MLLTAQKRIWWRVSSENLNGLVDAPASFAYDVLIN